MNMTTEKGEKNLLINVSKDELDKIDEILQPRQPDTQYDKKTNKLPVASRPFISGSAKLHLLIQASGVVNELCSISKQNETKAVFNDGNDSDCNISYENVPETLEDLILFEHNYAVKYAPSVKSKKNEDENVMETEDPKKCYPMGISDISSVAEVSEISSNSKLPEVSSNSKVPEVSSITTPIRRSKRQIEKLEREQVAATNVDTLDPEVPKEKIVKNEEKILDIKDSKSLKIETNLNSDIKLSNYKTFAEFKKRHLKVVIEDCKSTTNADVSVPLGLPKSTVESPSDSLDNKYKNDSALDDKDIQNLKNPEPLAKSKYLRRSKIHKPSRKEFDEKSNIHSPHLKKRKFLNSSTSSSDSSPKKSLECEEKSDKGVNKNAIKERKKTIEHIKQKNLSHSVKKRKKHLSSSEKISSNSESHQIGDSPVSKRKKCVSFSEDLLLSDKPEAVARKQRLSSDFKESPQKSASNSPINSASLISKIHKKKILRRDSLRLINDGPALFSQPDIMVKVSVDDNSNKKEEKEFDSIDRLSKVKATDMPAIKNNPKETKEIKENQTFKDKSERGKLSLKTQQEKEVIKVMHGGEKLTSKLKQDDKGKNFLKQEDKDKQASEPEDKYKQTFEPEDKDKQSSELEEKDKQASEPEHKDKQLYEPEDKDKQASEPEDKDKQASELEDKDKQASELEDKDKQASEPEEKEELKQDLKSKSEEGEFQVLKQEDKQPLILSQEEKENKASTQDEPKENNFLKAVEEPAEKHLEEKLAEKFQEETLKDRKNPACNEETSHVYQTNFSDQLQHTESASDQQKEIQHSYNDFTNIEAFLESSKFHATVQEVEKNTSKDSKSVNKSMVEVLEKVADKKCSKEAPKPDGDEKASEPLTHSESDSRMLDIEEPKLIPERKSRRLIKKKEFFGDVDDSSDNKKPSASKNKRTSVDKSTGRGKKLVIKNKNVDINGKSDNMEEDNSTDPDSSEEDDPEKLWCICRKPHNSRFMIQCDKCEDWFHGSCVGVTKQHGRQLEKQKKEWNCPNCRIKGDPSPLKVEKSKLTTDIKNPNEKNSTETQHEDRKKLFLHDQKALYLENNKILASHSSTDEHLPTDIISLKKNNINSSVEKSKTSKLSISKQSAQKPAAKQNSSPNPKTLLQIPKLSCSSKQFSLSNVKLDANSSTPIQGKSTSALLGPKGKLSSISKEKVNVVLCVNCRSQAMANAVYCSSDCIDKQVAQSLKSLQNKSNLKGPEFDLQRLVVLDRLNCNQINENGPTAGEIVSWLKSNPSFIVIGLCNNSPSSKKDASSPKKEAESNSSLERRDSTDESAKTTIRLNVRKTLKNILLERIKKADDLEMSDEDVQKIAVKIEEELNALFKDNSFKYRAKYRSLMFNIKDPRNQGLFRKILKGNIPPDRLVRMTPEELASMELAKWREQENQHLLDMIKRVQLEQQKSGSGLLLKKTHKGEVEIEDDLTSIIEQDIPKTVLKDVPEDLGEPEKEEVKDSTHLHRSHLFDLNCKICTGKIVPPPVDENVPKKVRVAHSISVDLGSPSTSEPIEKPKVAEAKVSEGLKVAEAKSPVSNAGDDSMDQVPTSTVSIESPEINTKSSLKDTSSKNLSSVWKGFIFMQDIAKFVTSAYKVSGPTDHLQADLPDTIQVCGRIVPDQVWDYLGKIKQSGNKELVIIRFQAANDEEAVTYHSFYSYLSSRKRYGVVSNYSKKIKDFYLLPLASTSPVPMVLVPFDGPGLPSPRPHLLLGVIVRHKFKQASLPVVPKQLPSSKAEVEVVDDSYTPPHEPRSYTPPLPTSSILDGQKKLKDKSIVNLDPADKEDLNACNSALKDPAIEKSTTLFSGKIPISDASSFIKEDDKPYDPEQDILNIPSEARKAQNTDFSLENSKERSSVNLEQQKKILDALSRQVEETENALKQLVSQPEDDSVVQSPSGPSLDINSVAETGMSSFLDLPENLQEILNAVRLKTHDKEIGDVDMRIKNLFGKHFNEQKNDGLQHTEISKSSNNSSKSLKNLEVYDPQAATPPPNDEDMDRSTISCPSDPRIKLRTSFQDLSFNTKDTYSSSVSLSKMSVPDVTTNPQKHLPMEADTGILPCKKKCQSSASTPPSILLADWNSGREPPPPGIEPSESSSEESLSIQASSNTAVPQGYGSTVQDTSQHVNSAFYPQSFSSFQPHLPLGFSVHTPPPNIKHFPPPPIVSTSFPPPLPMHVAPPQSTECNLVKDQWPALQPPSHQAEGNEWHAGSSHWKESTDHQGNQAEGDSRYYSSDRSNDYGNDNFYKRDTSSRHWDRPRRFTRGHWVKNSSRGRFTNERRGKREPSFRRNLRN